MATRAYRTVDAGRVEQRQAPRLAAAVSRAGLRRPSEQPVEAMLLDVSIYGCRLESGGVFVAGERVWIRLAGSMPVAASVVWQEGGVTGCRFEEPIDRRLLRSLTIAAA